MPQLDEKTCRNIRNPRPKFRKKDVKSDEQISKTDGTDSKNKEKDRSMRRKNQSNRRNQWQKLHQKTGRWVGKFVKLTEYKAKVMKKDR